LNATYRVEIDGRRFEFSVYRGHLAPAHGDPDVTVTAAAADLATARLGSTEGKRKAALRRITFDGDREAIDTLRSVIRCWQVRNCRRPVITSRVLPTPCPPTTAACNDRLRSLLHAAHSTNSSTHSEFRRAVIRRRAKALACHTKPGIISCSTL
jgi:hypothetical protein